MTGLLSRLADRARGTRAVARPVRDIRFPHAVAQAVEGEEEREPPPPRRRASLPVGGGVAPRSEAGPTRPDTLSPLTPRPRAADPPVEPVVQAGLVRQAPPAAPSGAREAAPETGLARTAHTETVPATRGPSPQRPPRVRPPPAGHVVPPSLERPAGRRERERAMPDEPRMAAPPAITIEIGRVEVVAPARSGAPRAPAQPDAARLTTLADHLARRSGR